MPGFDSARAIFCTIAWAATLMAALVFVISFFADFDGGPDAADADIGLFSFRAVLGFFLGFGWGGTSACRPAAACWQHAGQGWVWAWSCSFWWQPLSA